MHKDGNGLDSGVASSKQQISHIYQRHYQISHIYQRPSGDVLIVVKNVYYLIDFPSYNVKSGYNGQSIENLGIPKGKRIYAIFRTYSGKTYSYIYIL
jgi:hypothetical protein